MRRQICGDDLNLPVLFTTNIDDIYPIAWRQALKFLRNPALDEATP